MHLQNKKSTQPSNYKVYIFLQTFRLISEEVVFELCLRKISNKVCVKMDTSIPHLFPPPGKITRWWIRALTRSCMGTTITTLLVTRNKMEATSPHGQHKLVLSFSCNLENKCRDFGKKCYTNTKLKNTKPENVPRLLALPITASAKIERSSPKNQFLDR